MRSSIRLVFILSLSSNLIGDGQRIDPFLNPLHYDLVVLPIISGGSPRLCGHVFVDVQPTRTTNLVTLHAVDLTIVDVSVRNAVNETAAHRAANDRFLQLEDLCFSGLFVQTSKAYQTIQEEPERVRIVLNQVLIKGRQYRIGLYYVGKVRDDPRGFFRANYQNDVTSCCHRG